MIKTTLSTKALQQKLTKLARDVANTGSANAKVATSLYAWVARNFASEGGLAVGGWAPLAPSTVKRKAQRGLTQMLVETGLLSRSAVPFSDPTRAGVRMQRLTAGGAELARIHHFGTRTIPARQLIPTREQALEMGLKVYRIHVRTAREQAGL